MVDVPRKLSRHASYPATAWATFTLPRIHPSPQHPVAGPSGQVLERSRGSDGPALWNWGWTRKPQAEARSPELSHANDMQNRGILMQSQLGDQNIRLREAPGRQMPPLPRRGRNHAPKGTQALCELSSRLHPREVLAGPGTMGLPGSSVRPLS